MYLPLEDFINRYPDGSIEAKTRGHQILIDRDGTIVIRDRLADRVVFEKDAAHG
jgi:hypothetical protein